MPFEVPNTYTEEGADAARIAQSATEFTWDALERQDEADAFFDFGADFFSDFRFAIKLSALTVPATASGTTLMRLLVVANSHGSNADISTPKLGIQIAESGANQFNFIMVSATASGSNNDNADNLDSTVDHFILFTKDHVNSVLRATIRTGSHRGTIVGDLTVAIADVVTLQYVNFTVSMEDGASGTLISSGTISEVDLIAPVYGTPSHFKPPLGAQIIKGHPYAVGMKACVLANEGSGLSVFDLARGDSIGLGAGSTIAWDVGRGGHNVECTSGGKTGFLSTWQHKLGSHSFVAIINNAAGSGGNRIIWAESNNIVAGGVEWIIDANEKLATFFYNGALRGPYASAAAVPSSDNQMIGGSINWDTDVVRYYINGQFDSEDAIDGTPATYTASDFFGVFYQGNNSPLDGPLYALFVWDRVLADSEFAFLNAFPYAMIERPEGWIWTPAAAAAGGNKLINGGLVNSRLVGRRLVG